jgi:hypothetical protein
VARKTMRAFLGSSTEALEDLRMIAAWLEEVGIEALAWDAPSLFVPGDNTFLRLIELSQQVDAAIFIFSEDDKTWYRDHSLMQPRDNVLLEYGLFVGSIGEKRAIICSKGRPKLASDLFGLIHIDISPNNVHRARQRFSAWAKRIIANEDPPILSTPSILKTMNVILDQNARIIDEIELVRGRLSLPRGLEYEPNDTEDKFRAVDAIEEFMKQTDRTYGELGLISQELDRISEAIRPMSSSYRQAGLSNVDEYYVLINRETKVNIIQQGNVRSGFDLIAGPFLTYQEAYYWMTFSGSR